MRLNKVTIGPKLYITLCFIFFYLPIAVTMFFSFNDSKSLTNFTGFSLHWYEKLLTDQNILSAVYVSISIAIFATILSTILGTITAIGLSKSRKLLKDMLLDLNNIPIMNPDIVTAISLMILFTSAGMERGYITMLLAHVAFCTPFVITSVYPKVRSMDTNLADVAMDLGATPFQALTKVVVPLLKPGIIAGMLLAFTMSLDDFVVSYFVTGNGVANISIIVYNMTKRMNPTVNALSTLLILAVVIVMVFVNLLPVLRAKKKRKAQSYKNSRRWTRRLKPILAGVLVLAIGLTCVNQFSAISNKQVLRVFNSGEYVDMELVEQFEQENNCTVVYETYDSNESMYTKLQSGSTYDILVPSDYMIEKLIDMEYLKPLDWKKIKNRNNIIPSLLADNSFDKGNRYSVPYYWGSVGIVYDTTVVDEKDLSQGWEILRNPKYAGNLYMYDSERDSFMVALKSLGYSMNSHKKSELKDAYDWLIDQRNTMNPVYVGDDVMDNMISGNKAMAVVYSGDGTYIIDENDDMSFFTPKQGTNTWTDAMVMTKDCRNEDLAYKWIDFFLREDVARTNTEYIGYDSAVKSVYDYYRDDYYKGNPGCAPDVSNPLNEVFHNQDQKTKAYTANLWTKIKSHK